MAWRTEFDNHQVNDRFDVVIWTDDNRVVARIPQADPVWSDEANAQVAADANLIAAAPDLLAALEPMLIEFGARLSDGKPLGYTVASMNRALELVKAAEAAIDKARKD